MGPGVGFRPYIYRLANKHSIKGWVENRNDGVIIHAESKKENLKQFFDDIITEAPKASNIHTLDKEKIIDVGFKDFRILKSENNSDQITDISPDICVCDACLQDLKSQPHRIRYPFTNCTNCGPRFSIIKDLPYDRDKTTMEPFIMCQTCQHEYEDVLDRRFHAQPVACNNCGPKYTLITDEERITDFNKILSISASLIEEGKIIAIKGVGGFQLACDALNEKAVRQLRERKIREGKPFAVMFSTIDSLKEYTHLTSVEEQSITSWRRPIVIAKTKKELAAGISVGFPTTGVMLPYMPFHYQLFEQLKTPAIVLTSGNISDEPIVIANEIAESSLTRIADAILVYNREIYNRTDDSVAIVINEKERMIRRSRSYSPEPVNLHLNVDGIVATGAELVNCFCIGKGNQAILSQHIGDLKNLETLEFFEESFDRFLTLFRVKPEFISHDLHPDYLSSKFAKEFNARPVAVQHHHAHIAACMAEHNFDEKVIGVSLDGTGLGIDGNIWGGEFFIADLAEFERYSHFEYIPLPGGDKVTKEPWRSAVSLLYLVYGKELFTLDLPFLDSLDKSKVRIIVEAIEKNINCPLSSGAGRYFDAVAALINICTHTKFHAEAPMRLESIASENCDLSYPFTYKEVISFKPIIVEIINDLMNNVDNSIISAKFHNTIINVVLTVVKKMRSDSNINKVVLSGGSFQNKYISTRLENMLEKDKFDVFVHQKTPANDGGIALGQLVIAAKRRELGLLNLPLSI
ncbi:MAG: carbamoyltransferase HypF [Bacteroidales bacterium]